MVYFTIIAIKGVFYLPIKLLNPSDHDGNKGVHPYSLRALLLEAPLSQLFFPS